MTTVNKKKANIYNVLLGISLIALSIGCVLLLVAWSSYGFSFAPVK